MNAHSTIFYHDTKAQRVVSHAMASMGRPYAISPVRSECFDCVTMINEATGSDISSDWMTDGGDLPFKKIGLSDARPGDIIAFRMPWSFRPFHMTLMTAGTDIDDSRARIFGPYTGRAAQITWMSPTFRQYAIAAYRIDEVA